MENIKMTTKEAINFVLQNDQGATKKKLGKALGYSAGDMVSYWLKKDGKMPLETYKKWKDIYPQIEISNISKRKLANNLPLGMLDLELRLTKVRMTTKEAISFVLQNDQGAYKTKLVKALGHKGTATINDWLKGKSRMGINAYMKWKTIYPSIEIIDVGRNIRIPLINNIPLGTFREQLFKV